MGKAEQWQAKIFFDGGRRKGGTPSSQMGEEVTEVVSSDMSVKAMFLELKTSLTSIDAKLDHLTEQLYRIMTRVDDHDSRLDRLEAPTSDMKDQRQGERAQLLQMEKVLEAMFSERRARTFPSPIAQAHLASAHQLTVLALLGSVDTVLLAQRKLVGMLLLLTKRRVAICWGRGRPPQVSDWLRNAAFCREQLATFWELAPAGSSSRDIWAPLRSYLEIAY
ncbi:hypothetical protein NDU88_000525 [Pleurodeles waltl]|uniref:Uncharacterized protein n=1 Tax=Pleurodeles waltl TaxID=8319 RepID=A0AAV7P4F6_PLEWA|nr:hypothetical protein NDU88_000525 [Pleurodeles waltl]